MEQSDSKHDEEVQLPKKPVKKPMSAGVVAVCVICGCIMFLGFWYLLFSQFFKGLFGGFAGDSSAYVEQVSYGPTLDVVRVEGIIAEGQPDYQHQWTLGMIDNLIEDANNKGILLYVNSPGGGIYESDELYAKLQEYKAETKRPVYAYMAQEAASGGLYICMAADKIYAHRMTMTGSIGVIMTLTDTTGLQKLIGIKEDKVTSGKNKAMGNPLTEEQRQILQTMVDESYEIFVDLIAENRQLDRAAVYQMADGRVYSAKQAQQLGIIDEISTYEEALEALKVASGDESCEIYEQMPPASLWEEILYGVGTTVTKQQAWNDLDKITNYIEEASTPRLMYYRQ